MIKSLRKRDLSQAELDQRRAAARARWQKAGASGASLRRGITGAYPEIGSTITPKSAMGMMRQWGRTHRTERAIYTNPEMTQVLGRAIGDRVSVSGSANGKAFSAAKVPITVLHNHPLPAPLSIPDAAALVAKPATLSQARGVATWRQIKAFKEGSPTIGRIMAADPRGNVSSLSLRVSPEKAMPPIKRIEALHNIMVARAYNRAMDAAMVARAIERATTGIKPAESVASLTPRLARQEGARLAPMSHGHWKALDRAGIVNYQTTGNYSEAGRRAGEKLVNMSNRLSADHVARMAIKGNHDADILAMIISQYRKLKLFKYV